MYGEMTLKEFLDQLASDCRRRAAAALSALAGSLGAALAAMVAHLPPSGRVRWSWRSRLNRTYRLRPVAAASSGRR